MLTLSQAARESGYGADHIARLVRQGKIRNAGRPHAPRIRRADLPRKAGALTPAATRRINRVQVARSLIDPWHNEVQR